MSCARSITTYSCGTWRDGTKPEKGEKMTLQEFIDDARRQVADRRSREDQDRARRLAQLQALLDEAVAVVVARISNSIPEPLQPFVVYAGPGVSGPNAVEEDRLRNRAYIPVDFSVVAPGLQPMPFTAGQDVDWIERTAAASEPATVKLE